MRASEFHAPARRPSRRRTPRAFIASRTLPVECSCAHAAAATTTTATAVAKMQKLNEEALKRHARAMRLMREKEQARAKKEQAMKRELNAFVEDGPQVRRARERERMRAVCLGGKT